MTCDQIERYKRIEGIAEDVWECWGGALSGRPSGSDTFCSGSTRISITAVSVTHRSLALHSIGRVALPWFIHRVGSHRGCSHTHSHTHTHWSVPCRRVLSGSAVSTWLTCSRDLCSASESSRSSSMSISSSGISSSCTDTHTRNTGRRRINSTWSLHT